MSNKSQWEASRHNKNANSQLNVRHVCVTRTLKVPWSTNRAELPIRGKMVKNGAGENVTCFRRNIDRTSMTNIFVHRLYDKIYCTIKGTHLAVKNI